MKRKFLCLLLALCMVLSTVATVSADEITSGDWVYELSEGNAVILDYVGTSTKVTVPASIDGHPVTTLGGGERFSMFGDENVTSIVLPEGLQTISRYALIACTQLTNITIPDSVTSIGEMAFASCYKLSTITLPAGLERLPESAFKNSGLTSIEFPATLHTIGYGAFQDCMDLTSITIPGTVSRIGNMAFYGCFNLTSVILEDGVTSVGDGAFQCTGLSGVIVPASVTYIGHQAFGIGTEESYDDYVDNFVIYGIPGSAAEEYAAEYHRTFVPMDGENKNMCGLYTYWTFDVDTGKLTISGSGSVTDFDFDNKAPWHAIKDQITSVEIRSGVTHIGESAFLECENLTSVTLPNTLSSIGGNAFAYCSKLSQVNFPHGLEIICWQAFVCTALTKVELPDTVWLIQSCAFASCEELTYVKLPSALLDVGYDLFRSCISLRTVVMPKMPDLEGLNSGMFSDCDALTNIDFVSTSYIGPRMFAACNGLTELTIPAHITRIDQFAFNWCSNLATVTIPKNVHTISGAAFADCAALKTVFFLGDAPNFGIEVFRDDTLNAWYPAGNDTWTEEVMQQYGGNVTWNAYDPDLFLDVRVNSYCYAPIGWAVEKGITYGMTDTEFSPDLSCKRSQVVTFLWRAAGSPEPATTEHSFEDVKKGSFYEKAVLWAVENGITVGTDDAHFGPDLPCTRAQVVTFLWRAAGKPAASGEIPFTDVPAGKWYADPIRWAVENGITFGMTDTEFGTDGTCTRAQVVTFLYRVYN